MSFFVLPRMELPLGIVNVSCDYCGSEYIPIERVTLYEQDGQYGYSFRCSDMRVQVFKPISNMQIVFALVANKIYPTSRELPKEFLEPHCSEELTHRDVTELTEILEDDAYIVRILSEWAKKALYHPMQEES